MPFQKKMDLNMSDIIKVVPIFDGNHKDLDNFLNLIKLYHDQLKVAEQAKLITLILAVKISNCVRSKISLEETPDTFRKLKELLNKIFQSKRSVLEIQSELFNAKQTGSIENFIAKIESLVNELNAVQKKNLIDADAKTIHQLSDQLALNAFKNGLMEKLKPTVLASRPKNLLEAVETAREATKIIGYDTNNVSYLRNRDCRNNMGYRPNFDTNRTNNFRGIGNYRYNNNFRGNSSHQNFNSSLVKPRFANNNNFTNNNYNHRRQYHGQYNNKRGINSSRHGQYRFQKDYRKNDIKILNQSGNELSPPVPAEEDILTRVREMRIE